MYKYGEKLRVTKHVTKLLAFKKFSASLPREQKPATSSGFSHFNFGTIITLE
jgi:hypothetical protein